MSDASVGHSDDKAGVLEAKFYPIGHTAIEPVLVRIGPKPIMIGRMGNQVESTNTLSLGSLVTSRKHALLWSHSGKVGQIFSCIRSCAFTYENKQVYIKDNNSSTGTYINGQRIDAGDGGSSERQLYDQDIIRFGEDLEIKGGVLQARDSMIVHTVNFSRLYSNSQERNV